MKLHPGITLKLTLIFCIFDCLLLIGFGFLYVRDMTDALELAAQAEIDSKLTEKQGALETWLTDRQNWVSGIAQSTDLGNDVAWIATNEGEASHTETVRRDLSQQISALTALTSDFQAFWILDPQTGEILISTIPSQIGQDQSNTSQFAQGLLGPYRQKLGDLSFQNNQVLLMANPIYTGQGRLSGVLVAQINLDRLWKIIQRKSERHWTEESYLVNSSNQLVTLPAGLTANEADPLQNSSELLKDCLNGSNGLGPSINYRNVKTISGYAYLADQGVCLVVDISEYDITRPVLPIQKSGWIFTGLGLLAVLLLAYPIAQIVSRPVLALQEVVSRFTQGDLQARSPAKSRDEIGKLEQAFNLMAETLAEKEVQLEQKVQERSEELLASKTRNRALVDAMTDVILVADDQGIYRDIPQTTRERWYHLQGDLIGKSIYLSIDAETADQIIATIREALRTGKPASLEYARQVDGEMRWFYATASRLSEHEVVWVARDISNLKQIELALKESQRALETLFRNLPGMAYRCLNDPLWTMEFVSDGCFPLTGYSPEDLIQNHRLSFSQLIHPDDLPLIWEKIEMALEKKETYQLVYRIRTAQGIERIVWEQGQGVFSADGKLEALEGFVHDVTEQEKAHEELQKSEQKFRSLIENSTDGVTLVNSKGIIVEWNQAIERITGVRREELVGRPMGLMGKFMASPDSQTNLDLVEQFNSLSTHMMNLMRNGDINEVNLGLLQSRLWNMVIRRPDGELRNVQHAFFTFDTPDGKMIGTLTRDLTEQMRAADALQESEERYRNVFEHAPDIIFTIDAAGKITSLNPAFEAITGYPVKEWVGRPSTDLLPIENQRDLQSIMEELEVQNKKVLPVWITGQSGKKIPLEVVIYTIHEVGRLAGIFGIARDITERRQREADLETLLNFSAQLRSATTRAEMYPIILDTIADLFQSEGSSLVVIDSRTNEAVFEVNMGLAVGLTGKRFPAEATLSANLIQSGVPRVYEKKEVPEHTRTPDIVPATDFVAGIPLITENQVVGAVWISRNQPIKSEDVHLAMTMGEIAASAIHRAELHEEMERSLQRLSALNMIDRAINSSLDLQLTLNVFLSQLMAQLNVDATDILLLNPHTNLLEYTAGRGFLGKGIESTRIRLGEGVTGQAALNRQPVSLPSMHETDNAKRSFLLTGEGFASYFCVPLLAKGHLKGVLEVFHRVPLDPPQEWMSFFESLAEQATIAIDNAQLFADMQRSNVNLELAYDATIEGWSHALDLRDKETEGHTRRVVELTMNLARMMGYQDNEMVHLRRGALLHDIGKMGIPDNILLKPGPLTAEERAQMREHPVYANELLSPIGYLRPALAIPYAHHEKWDGSGYPRGLKGEEIPLAARLFSVVDVWDALTSDRPYRKAWSKAEAIEYIRQHSGVWFDPHVVDTFLAMIS